MKKVLSIVLIATLAISSVVGVTAAVTKHSNGASNIINAMSSSDELIFPDVTGTWKNETNDGCTLQIVNQDGNDLDLVIESHNENYTKIATAKVSVTLDTYNGKYGIVGTADFDYQDSFGSGGTGTIKISEGVIDLEINKEFDPCAAWNITPCTGRYVLESKEVHVNGQDEYTYDEETSEDTQTEQETLCFPDVTGLWEHESNPGCSLQIVNQNGNDLDLVIESHNENYTKIATAEVSVTLDTYYGEHGIVGTADFGYYDSFGSGGTGTITLSEGVIYLEINKEFDPCAAWNITPCTGVYTRA